MLSSHCLAALLWVAAQSPDLEGPPPPPAPAATSTDIAPPAPDEPVAPDAAELDPDPPPAPPPPPGANPTYDPEHPRRSQPRVEHPEAQGGKLAAGSIEICDTLTAPLGLIPTVGSAMGFVLEWACLVPGALAMDYTQLYHGGKDGDVWEAGVALVLAKLWRDLTRWPVVIGIGALGLTAAAVVIALAVTGALVPQANILGVPPEYAPVALTGILVGSGATFIVMRKLRKWGQAKIFDIVYGLLADDFDSPQQQQAAQDEAWMYPPLNGAERLWALAAMAGGSDPDRSWWYMIPIAGRYGKAYAMSEELKTDMRQVARDGLHEDRDDESLAGMDTMIDVLAYTEGSLAALADVLLLAGGVAFAGGSVVAAASYGQTQNVQLYAGLLLGIGAVGVLSAGTGVVLLLAREIPRFLRPILVPVAYGAMPPPGTPWFFKDDGNDPEKKIDALLDGDE